MKLSLRAKPNHIYTCSNTLTIIQRKDRLKCAKHRYITITKAEQVYQSNTKDANESIPLMGLRDLAKATTLFNLFTHAGIWYQQLKLLDRVHEGFSFTFRDQKIHTWTCSFCNFNRAVKLRWCWVLSQKHELGNKFPWEINVKLIICYKFNDGSQSSNILVFNLET